MAALVRKGGKTERAKERKKICRKCCRILFRIPRCSIFFLLKINSEYRRDLRTAFMCCRTARNFFISLLISTLLSMNGQSPGTILSYMFPGRLSANRFCLIKTAMPHCSRMQKFSASDLILAGVTFKTACIGPATPYAHR